MFAMYGPRYQSAGLAALALCQICMCVQCRLVLAGSVLKTQAIPEMQALRCRP